MMVLRWLGLIGLTLFCGLAQAGDPHLQMGVDYGTIFSSERPKKNEPKGCLAGSVGRLTEGKVSSSAVSIGIHFQGADASPGTRKRMSAISWRQPMLWFTPEIREGESVRDVFLICLRPGEYRLASFTFTYNLFTKYMDKPMRIPLKVEAGRTHYIGSFMLSDRKENHPCSGEDRGLRVILQDRAEVDMPLINRFVEGEPAFVDIPDVRGYEPLLYGCPPASEPSKQGSE